MPAPTETRGGFRLPLATSIFALFAVLIVLAIGAAIAVTYTQGDKIAEQAVAGALRTSSAVQSEFTQRRLEEVQLKVQLIAADPSFVKYVSDAQGGGLGLGDDVVLDSTSIGDLVKERQESFGFDIGMVLDPVGKVLARSDETEGFEQSLAEDPFIASALSEDKPISGYWRLNDKLYQAALWPLAEDQDLVGFLLVALEVDDELGTRVGKASGADIAYLLPEKDRVVVSATSLEAASRDALSEALAASGVADAVRAGTPMDRVTLNFQGQQWIGELAPVDAAGGATLGSALRFTSSDFASAGYRRILNLVGLTGLVSLLIALPLSFLLAKITLRPLKQMAKAAQDAAGGSYQTRIEVPGRDELAQLGKSFNQLLSDLREKSDIEGYVTNLSRFLPDPGQDREVPSFVTQQAQAAPVSAATPPRRESLLLLGLDLREFARPLQARGADEALAELAERATSVIDSGRRFGGRLVAGGGTRSVLGFSGADRFACALNAARDVLAADPQVAAAMIEGDIVHGTVNTDAVAAQTAVGPASFQLERLLGEAAPGRVMLPRGLGESAKTLLAPEAVPVVQGAVSAKPFYGLDIATLARVPAVEPRAIDTRAPTPMPADSSTATREVFTPRSAAAASAMSLKPGARLGGRYEILSVLGSGGMGVVYKARDLELDDVVALKMLKASALVDHEHLERLKSEIKLARKITHPNVLRTFDFGEVGGLPYISMEYVRGMTLRYLLRQAGRIPYSAALRIARQLVSGLHAAHEVGVLHRDIKPENLILEASGNAKLMDFGIARPIRRSEPGQTQPGMFVGTPAYSAPEQLAGEEVDHRADIYSSGVLLCEMFCGKLPFTGGNTMEIYIAQMQQAPVKPSQYWAEMPSALEAIILRCIERDAAMRYQSADELGAALAGLRA